MISGSLLAIALIIFAFVRPSGRPVKRQGNATEAKAITEAFCASYCSDYRIPISTLGNPKDGCFDVLGTAPNDRKTEDLLDLQLARIGWKRMFYQISLGKPDQFVWGICPDIP